MGILGGGQGGVAPNCLSCPVMGLLGVTSRWLFDASGKVIPSSRAGSAEPDTPIYPSSSARSQVGMVILSILESALCLSWGEVAGPP